MPRNSGWFRGRLEETQRIREYSNGEYSSPIKTTEVEAGELIKLDSNENLFIPKSHLSQIFREVAEILDPRLYPQSEKRGLVSALSDYLSLPPECYAFGNGSDELIETTIKAFLRRSERAISITPTFAMYKIIVEAHGGAFDTVPLGEDFSLDADALLSSVRPETVLCFICSPNNPTGNQLELSSVRKVAEEFKGIVLVDEAYVEFAPYSIKEAIKEFDNLIILRTFSKAFGLAGLRIGYSLACSEVTSILRRIQLPWNVNRFSMQMATKVLEKRDFFLDYVERIKTERSRLIKRLNRVHGVKAFNSDANFVFFTTEKDADAVFNELKSKGILVRNIGYVPGFNKCLRVTVGLPEMNDRFIDALDKTCDE